MKHLLAGIALLLTLNVCAQYGFQISYFTLSIDPRKGKISEEQKDSLWLAYLRLKEGTWLQVNAQITQPMGKHQEFLQIREYTKRINNFYTSEGLLPKHVKTKYSPTANVNLFKPKGNKIYCNFVSFDPKLAQHYPILASKGGTITTKKGNKIIFPPNAFKLKSKSDTVVIQLWEYSNKKEFVQNGYTSTANGKQLVSNGMFNINAYQDKAKVELDPEVGASIQLAKDNIDKKETPDDFYSFYGEPKNNVIDWKANKRQPIIDKSKPSAQNNKLSRRRRKVISKETIYVQLCKNLPLIESRFHQDPPIDKLGSSLESVEKAFKGSKLTSYMSSFFTCSYTQADYNFIVDKYGPLNASKGGKYQDITSYAEFSKLVSNRPNDIFLPLTPDQNKLLTQRKKDYVKEVKSGIQKETMRRKREEEERRRKAQEEAEKRRKEAERMQQRADSLRAVALKEEAKNFPIEMKINKLGQINCDRFYDEKVKTNVIVKLSDFNFNQIRVYAVFKDINSVMPAHFLPSSTRPYVVFNNLPVGREVLYVAATFKGDNIKLAYLDKTIAQNEDINLQLKNYSRKAYDQIISDLIPN